MMKNIIKVTVFVLILLLIICGIAYWLETELKEGTLKTFSQDITLGIIESLLFGFIILLFGLLFEQSWRIETHKSDLKNKIEHLEVIVERTFSRTKSRWNFNNRTPTFYFDDDWMNPLYDVLTQNNRHWENIIIDYRNTFKKASNPIIESLWLFLIRMEEALVTAEKIDTEIIHSHIAPGMAAQKVSHSLGDRQYAQWEGDLSFLVYRATWMKVNSTQMLFGISLVVTEYSLRLDKIESTSKSANKILKENKNLNKLVKILIKSRNKLQKLTSNVKDKVAKVTS